MAKITLNDITTGYLSATTFNANNTLIEEAIENTLSRDGTAPNTMSANLDMNSNKVVNLTDGTNSQDAVTVSQLNSAILGTAVITAGTIDAESSLDGYVLTSDGAGNAAWEAATGGTGIDNVVEDTTPQLGGTLDANGNTIDMGVNTITDTKVGQWDTAYGWGDHSSAGYASTLSDLSVTATASEINFLDESAQSVSDNDVLFGTGSSFEWRAITEADISDLGTYLTSADIATPETKYKSANEQITSDATLSADTHLTGFSLDANSYYKIEGFFKIGAASATPDFQAQLAFSNTPQDAWWSASLVDTVGNVIDDAAQYSSDLFLNMTTTNLYMGRVTGFIRSNATTGGTMAVHWAQNTLSADALTFYQGSWMTLTKIS